MSLVFFFILDCLGNYLVDSYMKQDDLNLCKYSINKINELFQVFFIIINFTFFYLL